MRADASGPVVIGLAGASGGLGTSTLTVATALRAASRAGRRVVAVDGDLRGGGLDATACAEHEPGLRWPDLVGLRGAADGPALVRRLPALAGVSVLSAGLPRGRERAPATGPAITPDAWTPASAVQRAVLHALRAAADVTVVDLARAAQAPADLLAGCDVVVLLTGREARHLADAEAAVLALDGTDAVWLVTRGAGDLAEAIGAHLGLALLCDLADDPRAPSDARRGRPPGDRGRGVLVRAADAVVTRFVAVGEVGEVGRVGRVAS